MLSFPSFLVNSIDQARHLISVQLMPYRAKINWPGYEVELYWTTKIRLNSWICINPTFDQSLRGTMTARLKTTNNWSVFQLILKKGFRYRMHRSCKYVKKTFKLKLDQSSIRCFTFNLANIANGSQKCNVNSIMSIASELTCGVRVTGQSYLKLLGHDFSTTTSAVPFLLTSDKWHKSLWISIVGYKPISLYHGEN